MPVSKEDVYYLQDNPKKIADEINGKLTAIQAVAQADSTAPDIATLVSDFNSLLAKLRTAGILAP